MTGDRRYAVIGAGAVGGLYGARLHAAGLDVHFLLRSDYEHVRRHGLVVESPDGDLRLEHVNAYNDAREMPTPDVVIVALKATEREARDRIIEDLLGGRTEDGPGARRPQCVVLLQNGLSAEAEVAEMLARIGRPDAEVIGGLAFLCSQKAGPGHVRHLDYGPITLAAHRDDGEPAGVTAAMRSLGGDCARAGIVASLEDDLVQARWRKLCWNVPYNGLSVLLGATSAELTANPDSRSLVEALMREVAAGAAAFGRRLGDEFIPQLIAATERMTPYLPSMRLDFDAGRPMEVEAIYGEPLRAAADRGVALPRIETLYRQLSALDARAH